MHEQDTRSSLKIRKERERITSKTRPNRICPETSTMWSKGSTGYCDKGRKRKGENTQKQKQRERQAEARKPSSTCEHSV